MDHSHDPHLRELSCSLRIVLKKGIYKAEAFSPYFGDNAFRCTTADIHLREAEEIEFVLEVNGSECRGVVEVESVQKEFANFYSYTFRILQFDSGEEIFRKFLENTPGHHAA